MDANIVSSRAPPVLRYQAEAEQNARFRFVKTDDVENFFPWLTHNNERAWRTLESWADSNDEEVTDWVFKLGGSFVPGVRDINDLADARAQDDPEINPDLPWHDQPNFVHTPNEQIVWCTNNPAEAKGNLTKQEANHQNSRKKVPPNQSYPSSDLFTNSYVDGAIKFPFNN
jgi:hypothetical protein